MTTNAPSQVVLLDRAESVAHGVSLFPLSLVLYANGELPAEAAGFQDAVSISPKAEWIQTICAALAAAQCKKIRYIAGSIDGLQDAEAALAWVRQPDRLQTYKPSSAPPAAKPDPPADPPPAQGKAQDGAEPSQEGPEPPAIELPPLEAYSDTPAAQNAPKQRKRPRLAAVDGNLAIAPEAEREAMPEKMSEDALAEHFVSKHGEDWRFVRKWFQWYEWDGASWREDVTGKVNTLAIAVTREALLWPEAAQMQPKEKRLINRRSVAGAVRELACDHRKIAAIMEQWDKDTFLLGCPNGVLDLKSGKLLEPEREHYITKQCAVTPESGPPELWLKFMDTVCGGDASLIAYLQRFAGYCLTGETSEHSLVFCHGTGANGKTVFLQTLANILGDYAISAGIETFTETKNERHSTEIARLRGARLVVTEETDAGGRWAEGKIKRLTGGGKISAHFMRQDDFEYTPQFKLLIASNHKPMLRSTDEAIRRRFHMVPFAVTIPVEERDHGLMEKLRAEYPRILGWMLDGCVAWQDCGLGLPEAIQNATDDYLNAEDVLGQWLSENCERKGKYESQFLYRNYSDWCEKQGERPWSRRAWANAITDRGFATGKVNGARGIIGLQLLPSAVSAPAQYS